MSELKAFDHEFIPNEYGKFYLKSEADKVIADLEMKLARAQLVLRLNKPEALYSNLETMSRLSHKIHIVERRECHHKYKRCLAMADFCDLKMSYWAIREIHEGDTGKFELYSKWHKRWLELAEKFKEVK